MKTLRFRRIIASGKFIPEIDGLRFVAISSVVLYHIHVFLRDKNLKSYQINDDISFAPNFIYNGSLGVELFFVISGFILGLFFASAYRFNKSVNHKSYFIRRLTRLEPPYILSLVVLFLGAVFVVKSLPLDEAIKSLFASIFYIHNILYTDTSPLLITVAWSLEVEIQFYILAPLLGLIFKIQNNVIRKSFLLFLCIVFPLLSYLAPLPFISIYDYVSYFLLGFLITDIYIDQEECNKSVRFSLLYTLACALLLVVYFYMGEDDIALTRMHYKYMHLIPLFIVFYIVLIRRKVSLLKKPWISNIGGACYSIYLLHYPIISLFGNKLVQFQFTQNKFIDNLIYGIILLITILVISMIFYLLIERPCMDKEWPKKFVRIFHKGKEVN